MTTTFHVKQMFYKKLYSDQVGVSNLSNLAGMDGVSSRNIFYPPNQSHAVNVKQVGVIYNTAEACNLCVFIYI